MSIKDKILGRLSKEYSDKKVITNVMEKVEGEYEEKKEEGTREGAINHAAKVALKELTDQDVIKLTPQLAEAIEKGSLPDEVVRKMINLMVESEEIRNEQAIEVAQNVQRESVSDSAIIEMIENNEMDLNTQGELVSKITDPDVRKEQEDTIKKKELDRLLQCREISEVQLVNKIKDIIGEGECSREIQQKINRIIARKIAYNYRDFNGTKIDSLSSIISPEEMFKDSIPDMVEVETCNIRKKEGKGKYNSYSSHELINTLLQYMSIKIAENYYEVGEFIIPQSDNMKNLEESTVDKFIKHIEKSSGKSLSRMQVRDIKSQIKGITGINKDIEKFGDALVEESSENKRKQIVNMATHMVQDERYYNTIKKLVDEGLIGSLESLDKEKRDRVIEEISKSVDKRIHNEKEVDDKQGKKPNLGEGVGVSDSEDGRE